jgi:hypothetical protein
MESEHDRGEHQRLIIREDAVKDLEVSESEVAGHDERLLLAPPTKPGPSPGGPSPGRHDF